jgi:TolA-binding protein
MKCLPLFLSLTFLGALTACKTQEDIRRDKSVETLNEQITQTQKSTANAGSRFMAIEEQVARLQGQVEEVSHNKQQDIKEAALLRERLSTLEETNKKQNELIKTISEKIQEQSSYIEQVIKSLSSLTDQQKGSSSKKKELQNDAADESTPEVASVKSALASFKAKDYEAAKSTFLEVLKAKKVKKKDKEASFYYLGQIEYKDKNYEESKVYFSKLFSENPESSLAAPALLGLAKSFIQLKSHEEATQSLDELITRFPKSKEAVEAAKIKAKK